MAKLPKSIKKLESKTRAAALLEAPNAVVIWRLGDTYYSFTDKDDFLWWKGENVKKPKRRGPRKTKETPDFNESDYNF
jgi:hypothetical protein